MYLSSVPGFCIKKLSSLAGLAPGLVMTFALIIGAKLRVKESESITAWFPVKIEKLIILIKHTTIGIKIQGPIRSEGYNYPRVGHLQGQLSLGSI